MADVTQTLNLTKPLKSERYDIEIFNENTNIIDRLYANTVGELKTKNGYKLGDVVEVLGEVTKGDGAHHKRIAKDKDDGSGEQGQNGIWWCLVENSMPKTLREDIDKNREDIEKVEVKLKEFVKYPNFKGEYDPNRTYLKDDVIYMSGHELGYVHEIIDGGYSDPFRYKETRRDFKISDVMYYKFDGQDWEMLLTELDEVSLNLYTVAHKPPTQNYETTWDNFFPYSEIGRWLVHKDTCEEIAKMDKIYGDRREGASSAVANDWNGTNGDIAVKIPKLYVNYKHTSRGKRIRFYSYKNPTKKISLEAYVHPAFVTDFEAEAIYMGATKGRNISGQLRACEGALQVSQNIGWFLTASRANRTTDYCITPFSLSCLLQDLFLMEFGSVHSQEILGQGRSNTTSASNAGTTKTLGDRSGRVSTDDRNGNVSYRGIEDCFGNIWEFGVGLIVDDNGYYHTNKLSAFNDKSKMTRLPISTILLDLDNQRIKSYAKMDSKNINHLNIPVEIGASDSTYYTDGFWCHDKGEENIALLFGCWDHAGACGMRALFLSSVASHVISSVGARFTFFKR